jgi:membrane-bound ClpP family serine protease
VARAPSPAKNRPPAAVRFRVKSARCHDDAIQPITAEYIARALDTAQADHDQAVLIEINTPGGLVDSTREIIEKIVASQVPVII